MFCRKCGEQLPDDAKFCRKCGTLVQLPEGWQGQTGQTDGSGPSRTEPSPVRPTEPSPIRPVKRTPAQRMRLIAAVAAAVLILLGALAGAVYGITPAQRARRQVTLGDRYLEQMEYERAIAAYEKAIAIDPNNTAAYQGLNTSVESYATMVSSEGESVDREQARKVADAYKRLEDVIRDAEERDIDTGIPEERKDEITGGREKFDRIANGEAPEEQDPDDGASGEGQDGAQRVDYAPYEKILELYREGSRKYAGDSGAATEAYIENADPMLNAFAFYAEMFEMRIIYALYDIDGNGIHELLVGTLGRTVELGDPSASPVLCAVYTLDRNGTVYPVIRDLTERMLATVYEDGTIYLYGSNGAASGIADFYRFEDEGPEAGLALYLEDEVIVDFERDPIRAYFRGDEQMDQEEFNARYEQRPEITPTWRYMEMPVTEYVETVFGAEEDAGSAAGEVDAAVWKKAYRDYLASDPDLHEGVSKCGMIYADGDRVPEVIVNYGYEYQGTSVLSYQNGRVETYTFDRYGGIRYMEGTGLLYSSVSSGGVVWEEVARLDRDGFHYLGSGAYEYDRNTMKNYAHVWGEQDVSEEVYEQSLKAVFPAGTDAPEAEYETLLEDFLEQLK